MQAKESSARATLGGWVEKNGAFSLSTSSPVIGRFERRTVLRGKIERESGLTVVRGDVPSGVDKQGQLIVFIALALLAVLILTSGNVVPALFVIPLGAYLYIPMTGDRANSETLMTELQRALKAKATPPKKAAEPKDGARSGAAKAASARRSTGTTRAATTTRAASAARSTSKTTAARKTGTPSSIK